MVSRRTARRRWLEGMLGATALSVGAPVHALMAGNAPDSPTRRLDPNTLASPFSGVGSISANGGVYSGVLIGPRHAITAHHVLPAKPTDALFNLNLDGDLTHRLTIRRAVRHPAPVALGNGIHAGDLAIIEFAEPVPDGARIYPIASGVPALGTVLTLVGYGASGVGGRAPSVAANAALKRVGENAIDGYLGAPNDQAPLVYLFRFDAPPGAGRVRTRSLGNLRETGLAGGDSGSPAFVRVGGTWQLLGINSFVAQSTEAHAPFGFGTLGGGQLLAPHHAWITAVLADRP